MSEGGWTERAAAWRAGTSSSGELAGAKGGSGEAGAGAEERTDPDVGVGAEERTDPDVGVGAEERTDGNVRTDGQRSAGAETRLSCVILTRGDRSAELDRAVASVADQRDVAVQIVVVGNGADVPRLSRPVTVVRLPCNAGVPAGRNRGVASCSGDVVLFLDDDGWYPSRWLAAGVRDAFRADPLLGVLSLRVQDPSGDAERRHVPRLRAGDPGRSGPVTTFLGGACAVRRELFDLVGGLPEEFFYAHEETDFAWRVLDAGYRIRYDGTAVLHHPTAAPTRHAEFYRMNARNRVWLARRNLPWPLAGAYLCTWVAITVVREHSPAALAVWFRGFREGWREPCGPRQPMSWRTAWVMTRVGRPPVV